MNSAGGVAVLGRPAETWTLAVICAVWALCMGLAAVRPLSPEAPVGLIAGLGAAVLSLVVPVWFGRRRWRLHLVVLALVGSVSSLIGGASTGAGAAAAAVGYVWAGA